MSRSSRSGGHISFQGCRHDDNVRSGVFLPASRVPEQIVTRPAARKAQGAKQGHFDKHVVAKRTKRHLDELEVRCKIRHEIRSLRPFIRVRRCHMISVQTTLNHLLCLARATMTKRPVVEVPRDVRVSRSPTRGPPRRAGRRNQR